MSLDQFKADWREGYRQKRIDLKVQHPRVYWFVFALCVSVAIYWGLELFKRLTD